VIQVTSIHMEGYGNSHEHIAAVRWVNPATHVIGESTRSVMVEWLSQSTNNLAAVWDGSRWVYIGVVKGTPPYIRTYADGVWTNNLLALPRY
jgi:hypothetical protein